MKNKELLNDYQYENAPDLQDVDEMDEKELEGTKPIEVEPKPEKHKHHRFSDYKGTSNFESKLEKIAKATSLRECKNYDYFIILPDETFSFFWNLIMSVLYLLVFIFVPLRLAFSEEDDLEWIILDAIADVIFLADIILNFFKAYYNKYFVLIDTRKEIAFGYLTSWFIIDVIATFPFYLILQSKDYTSLFRLLRLFRLWRTLKLTKLFKASSGNKGFLKCLYKTFKMRIEMERIIIFVIMFFLFCHVMACFWVIAADLEKDDSNNWLTRYGFRGKKDIDIYIAAYYYIITTFSTVGYGDISPGNNLERCFGIFLEIVGILAFSFAISSLTALLEKFDDNSAELKAKLDVLEDIKREFNIGPGLYDILRQSLKFHSNADYTDKIAVVNQLPYRLRVEVSAFIMSSKLAGIPFFQGKPKDFLAYCSDIIKPHRTKEGIFIFREGEVANNIYFLLDGKAAYALEAEKQVIIYISVKNGDMFGFTDLIRTNEDFEGKCTRKFSVLAVEECNMIRITIENFVKIKKRYPEIYDEVFSHCYSNYKKAMGLKRRAVTKILNNKQSINIYTKDGKKINIQDYN